LIRRTSLLLAAVLVPLAGGCWSWGDGPGDPPGAVGGPGMVVETAGSRLPWKGGRGLVVLDPLDWSGKYLEASGLKLERHDGSVRVPLDDAERTADSLAGAILALRRRMAVVAENVANAETARLPGAEAGAPAQPYRRKVLVVAANGTLDVAADGSPFRKAYRPAHPDADKDGRVQLPNVYVEVEMADWKSSVREYEALREALALVSGRYAAPPAELLPAPVPPPAHEEKPVPAPTPEIKPAAPIPAPVPPKAG
jgi:flagellar basal-body rod protein FlgC